ncbi:MAG TPA: hypothetical protein ENH53_10985 [Bacteroidetes bacterium]|nr:hypothetical protein [Bacteroidota bacterium]
MQAKLLTKNGVTQFAQADNLLNRYDLKKGVSQEAYNQLMASEVPFKISLQNIFDEIIDGTKDIEILITIWDASQKWVRHLHYSEIDPSDSVLLHPGENYQFYTADSLKWEQKDDEGTPIYPVGHYMKYTVYPVFRDSVVIDSSGLKPKKIHRLWADCDTVAAVRLDSVVAFKSPKIVYATASVKLFREYAPVQTDTLILQIKYIFPGNMLKKKKGCYPGFRGNGG